MKLASMKDSQSCLFRSLTLRYQARQLYHRRFAQPAGQIASRGVCLSVDENFAGSPVACLDAIKLNFH